MKTKNPLLSLTIAFAIALYITGLVMMSQQILDPLWSTASIRARHIPDGFEALQ